MGIMKFINPAAHIYLKSITGFILATFLIVMMRFERQKNIIINQAVVIIVHMHVTQHDNDVINRNRESVRARENALNSDGKGSP